MHYLKRLCILVSIITFQSHATAQTLFQKTFGGAVHDYCYAGQQTSDKGFAAFGYTNNFGAGKNDFYLLRTDSAGNYLWAKTYGGSGDDQGYAMQQTNDGGFILCGYSRGFSAGDYDVYLVKTNAGGDTLWSKTYGGPKDDFGNTVMQTADGGYIIGGYTTSYTLAGDSGSAYLLKTDAKGQLQWSESIGGGSQYTDIYSVKQLPDKGYALTGYTNSFGATAGDAFLCRTDSTGQILFTRLYGTIGSGWGTGLIANSQGGFVLTGAISNDSKSLNQDAFILTTNSTGDTLFTKAYAGTGIDIAQSVQICPGGYAIAGYTSSFGAGGYDDFLTRTNTTGDTLFSSCYGGSQDENTNALSAWSPEAGFALFGFSASYDTGAFNKMQIIRTDAGGRSSCDRHSCNFHVYNPPIRVSTVNAQTFICSSQQKSVKSLVNSGGIINDNCGHVDLHEEPGLVPELSIYPNPGSDLIHILLTGVSEGEHQLLLLNSLGQVVYSKHTWEVKSIQSADLNVGLLPAGLYLLKFNNGIRSTCIRLLVSH
jgi:hypothetical protein